MERRPYKQVLYNLPVAAYVDTSTEPGYYLINGLFKINAKNYLGYKLQTAAAEVVQVVTIGTASTPVIVAGQKYQIIIGHPVDQEPSESLQGYTPYGVTAPAVLTGSAGSDRHNVYTGLAYKINNTVRNKVTAYALVTLTHAAGTFVVGETLTGATTGATGIVITAASGTTTVGMTSTVMFAGTENLDDETGTGPLALATVTLGVGLRIVDDAGYYPSTGMRHGPSMIQVTSGFNPLTDITVTTAGVIGIGQGTDLLTRVPVYETTTANIKAGGEFGFPTNEAPVAGRSYNIFTLQYKVDANDDSALDRTSPIIAEQVIYADNLAAGYAAFAAAIAALT